MSDDRLRSLKRFIGLADVNGQLEVCIYSRRRYVRVISNVGSCITKFERDVVIVHVYRIAELAKTNEELAQAIKSMNYAEVFGSPWNLSGIGAEEAG